MTCFASPSQCTAKSLPFGEAPCLAVGVGLLAVAAVPGAHDLAEVEAQALGADQERDVFQGAVAGDGLLEALAVVLRLLDDALDHLAGVLADLARLVGLDLGAGRLLLRGRLLRGLGGGLGGGLRLGLGGRIRLGLRLVAPLGGGGRLGRRGGGVGRGAGGDALEQIGGLFHGLLLLFAILSGVKSLPDSLGNRVVFFFFLLLDAAFLHELVDGVLSVDAHRRSPVRVMMYSCRSGGACQELFFFSPNIIL